MDKLKITRRSVLAGSALMGAGGLAPSASVGAKATAAIKVGPALEPGAGKIPVAFLMDDYATMIDFAGPWEVFQDVEEAKVPGFSLFTVAGSAAPLRTTGSGEGIGRDRERSGLKFIADYDFTNAPRPRVLLIGAQDHYDDPTKRDWIRAVEPKADIVMSVCTGAFVLANSGLIDGLKATTHHNFFDSFERDFPKVKLVRGSRFVDNGKFISAGGLTSGIDAALHVVKRYYGSAAARTVADYMEYQSTAWRA